MKSFDELKKAFEREPIDWTNYEKLATDCWLFLTNDNLPSRANIKKEAFLHEVKVMIENAVLFNKPKPSSHPEQGEADAREKISNITAKNT